MANDKGRLIVEGVDITHARLVELTNLADQANAFYDWVESRFQVFLSKQDTLSEILQTASKDEIKRAIADCYAADRSEGLPLFFDGVGRSYSHAKACYYFFAWLIRDAPQQRLAPLIGRIVRMSGMSRTEAEFIALSSLICKYRDDVRTFSWEAIREVIIDRLEGSRRSIRGHEKEIVVRTALLTALQSYYAVHSNYGLYTNVQVANMQVIIGRESFDVSANLLDAEGRCVRRVLVPIKTRETEGGGHSHLFTRDVRAAINAARYDNADDVLIVVIVARNWSEREASLLREQVDHVALFDLNPSEFDSFNDEEQKRLNDFIASVLEGRLLPKESTDN
jgi:hypothetical protein